MTSPFKTRITDLFGIRLPIVAGCMQHLSTPEYVAAAASAGMIGFLPAASYGTGEALRAAIRRCRELTGERPFGVNISMLPKLVEGEKTEQFFDIILEEGVRFVETSGRSPEPYLPRLQADGVKVVHKVPAVKYARKAQSLGVDAVAVVGAECGGHPGMDLVGTMVQTAVAARDPRPVHPLARRRRYWHRRTTGRGIGHGRRRGGHGNPFPGGGGNLGTPAVQGTFVVGR
jgi:nitronate monooxygenase